jgi:inorganic pyrophosphatase
MSNFNKFKAHPWHGISIGDDAPKFVTAFIEILPNDTIKYEVDKASGYLKIDRPQKFSNVTPCLYGFIPQTYCDARVAAIASTHAGRVIAKGDGDPLDICVLSEREIFRSDIILQAKPIGGFRLIDGGEADDKIIAVLKGDEFYEKWNDISEVPEVLIRRLRHYFLTYKNIPGDTQRDMEISDVYNREEAFKVIKAAQEDYSILLGI